MLFEASSWLKSLSPPILVVGNAVLTAPIPEEEYPTIIRINNYVLGGLSGTKVTHWVANGYPDISHRPLSPVLIPWSLKMEKKRGCPTDAFHKRMEGTQILYTANDTHIRWWFPSAVYTGKVFPTTGFCLLALLRQEKLSPHIVGFDGMKTGHPDNPAFGHGHTRTRAREQALLLGWRLRRR